MTLRILAVEPFLGGSHEAFLNGLAEHSRHTWTVLGLSAHHWKWRMRHAPLTLSETTRAQFDQGQRWDLMFCGGMLNLAEFRGLIQPPLASLPAIVYFHENQLTYPVTAEQPRDYHFAFSNFMSAASAEQVWFNSEFHQRDFFSAFREFLGRMPDYRPLDALRRVEQRSQVVYPGIEPIGPAIPRAQGPLTILWAARWEHDKNPEAFFDALEQLEQQGVDFRLQVVGQSFREVPPVFLQAEQRWMDRIDRWGFQAERADYLKTLAEADVFVSTAEHEFFGISAVEAMAAGAYPVLPERLAYPELLGLAESPEMRRHFYDGTTNGLVERLCWVAELRNDAQAFQEALSRVKDAVSRFDWSVVAPRIDDEVERLVATFS